MVDSKKKPAASAIAAVEVAEFEQALVEFPLDRVLSEAVLWACNFFLLWDLGLTLRAHGPIDDDKQILHVGRIDVAEWSYVEGEKIERIEMTDKENEERRQVFLQFVRERLLSMKPDERKNALISLGSHGILDLPSLILA